MRLLVIGHSHAYSLMMGLELRAPAQIETHFMHLREPKFLPHFVEDGNELNNNIVEEIRRFDLQPSVDATALLLYGQITALICMFEQGERISTVNTPSDVDVTDCKYVPYNLVKNIMQDAATSYSKLLSALLPHIRSRVVVVQPPPPFPEHHIKQHPQRFEKLLAEHNVSPPWVRCAFWEAYCDVLKSLSASHNVQYLPIPIDSRDADGTLKDELRGHDAVHANFVYGSLVMSDLYKTFPAESASHV